MALTNAALVSGGSLAVTGGSSVTFAPTSSIIQGGLELVGNDTADIRTKTRIVCSSTMPRYNSQTKSYSKAKMKIKVERPFILADGSTSFQVARIEFEFHPEVTAAIKRWLLDCVAQVPFDADFTNFLDTGSLV